MTWLIPLRNLMRNRVRSALSILTIAGAVFSLIIFRGYTDDQMKTIQQIIVSIQFGHIQIATHDFWEPSEKKRNDIMLENADLIRKEIQKVLSVKSISYRLNSYGLVSTGRTTESGAFIGLELNDEHEFKNSIKVFEGDIQNFKDNGVMVAGLFAQKLGVKVGDEITLLSTTLDGAMNACDVRVVAIVAATFEEMDRVTTFVPLSLLQSLLDTQKIDYIRISLPSDRETERAQKIIQSILPEITTQANLIARPWREISDLFRKVDVFYGTQNRIILTILMTIVILGILNTVSMSINERIGEIGTLRALGLRQFEITKIFIIESFYMSLIGSIIGMFIAYVVAGILNKIQFLIEIPGASREVPVLISIEYQNIFIAISVAVISCLIATLIPAIRGVRIDIVEALRRNI